MEGKVNLKKETNGSKNNFRYKVVFEENLER